MEAATILTRGDTNATFSQSKFDWQSEQSPKGRLSRISVYGVSANRCVMVDDFQYVPNVQATKWRGALYREEPWAYEGFAVEQINPKPDAKKWPKLIVWVAAGEHCISVADISRFEKGSAGRP